MSTSATASSGAHHSPATTRETNSYVISVMNQKGGVGKTMITLSLAAHTAAANGRALVVDVDPQSNAHDLTRTMADPGYDGAGIGIYMPAKQPTGGRKLDINTRTRSAIQRSLRCLGERGFALLNQRWRTLQHITASPSKIGDIARAALVLTHFEHGYIS